MLAICRNFWEFPLKISLQIPGTFFVLGKVYTNCFTKNIWKFLDVCKMCEKLVSQLYFDMNTLLLTAFARNFSEIHVQIGDFYSPVTFSLNNLFAGSFWECIGFPRQILRQDKCPVRLFLVTNLFPIIFPSKLQTNIFPAKILNEQGLLQVTFWILR